MRLVGLVPWCLTPLELSAGHFTTGVSAYGSRNVYWVVASQSKKEDLGMEGFFRTCGQLDWCITNSPQTPILDMNDCSHARTFKHLMTVLLHLVQHQVCLVGLDPKSPFSAVLGGPVVASMNDLAEKQATEEG